MCYNCFPCILLRDCYCGYHYALPVLTGNKAIGLLYKSKKTILLTVKIDDVMKKLSFTLIIALLAAGGAWAQTFTVGNLQYNIRDANAKTVEVTNPVEEVVGKLVIPSKVSYNGTDYIVESLGYFIAPQYLFSHFTKVLKETNSFDIEELDKAISAISESSLGTQSQHDFEGLFDDMDLKSTKLGKDVKERSQVIGKVLASIDNLDLDFDNAEIDVLGDAYEYLIGMFAQTAGKKAGEFYTPQQVSKILARLVTLNKDKLFSVYDPCCGSGSLLLRVGKETKVTYYYGQEKTATTYNLARMNMLLHNIQYQHFEITNGDTLEEPAFMDKKFSAVVANPPYSAKWSADKKFLEDERFSPYGKLAPSSKADFAFVCHMLNSLDEDGTMAVVLPHGVLFRGSAEEQIRKVIIRDYNYLDTVIGLPANLFYGTSIPTCILVFKKNRPNKDILFIDASKEFDKGKNQNLITDEHIHKIIETYKNRQDVEKYAHVATIEEIEENDYNLNIPRYVDTFEEEEPIDLQAEFATLTKLQNESQNIDEELDKYFHELGLK